MFLIYHLMWWSLKNQISWSPCIISNFFHSRRNHSDFFCCSVVAISLLWNANISIDVNNEFLITFYVLLVLYDAGQIIVTVSLCKYTWFLTHWLCPDYILSISFETLLSALLKLTSTASLASLKYAINISGWILGKLSSLNECLGTGIGSGKWLSLCLWRC